MKFKQYDNGSCDIEFSKEEIEILNKKEKLHLTSETFKHFGNMFIKLVMDWNEKFDEKTKNLMTNKSTKIDGQ
jgi:hypothetical protein